MAERAERAEMGEDGLVAEIEKKITEAFEVFDRESNKTVDVSNYTAETAAAELSERKGLGAKWFPIREIGCIVRSLGCFPTEAEVQELLEKIEVEEPGGFVHLEHFLPVMTKVLLDRRFRPIPEDVILHAFEALDENKCGYITKDDLVKHLTQGGEPFTQEEMEDMLAVALDPVTDTLHYRDYRTKLIVDETKTFPFNV